MTKLGVSRLAEAWRTAQEAYDRGDINSSQWQAIFAVQRLADQDAETLWGLITEVLSLRPKEEVLEILAAGPLEDLISEFGAEMLSQIEARAETDEVFRALLSGVWIRTPTDAVGRRYEALGCSVVAAPRAPDDL